ncbi:hypothetical protein CMEL01_01315 [Colletotrichum melonis]|uniref:Uncharacterized protein n=1 Tax=Colletotrichum melonis TaxID=1209925 RepID=A0AAI9V8B8_9PEZI|nr:hypothetical protein CMEL01_01315 [Colletotrichum melonis]
MNYILARSCPCLLHTCTPANDPIVGYLHTDTLPDLPTYLKLAQASRYMHLLHPLGDIQCLFFPPLPRRIPFLTELTLL